MEAHLVEAHLEVVHLTEDHHMEVHLLGDHHLTDRHMELHHHPEAHHLQVALLLKALPHQEALREDLLPNKQLSNDYINQLMVLLVHIFPINITSMSSLIDSFHS